jgi:hypothetical protein
MSARCEEVSPQQYSPGLDSTLDGQTIDPIGAPAAHLCPLLRSPQSRGERQVIHGVPEGLVRTQGVESRKAPSPLPAREGQGRKQILTLTKTGTLVKGEP